MSIDWSVQPVYPSGRTINDLMNSANANLLQLNNADSNVTPISRIYLEELAIVLEAQREEFIHRVRKGEDSEMDEEAREELLNIINKIRGKKKNIHSKITSVAERSFWDNLEKLRKEIKASKAPKEAAINIKPSSIGDEEKSMKIGELVTIKIESQAFKNQQPIPAKYTCDGKDISPPLSFGSLPANTKSLALVVDDPDAPMGVFDHWIVWNISPDTKQLTEGAAVPYEGTNHFGVARYRGPCPPKGKPHHYHFKVYALDILLELIEGSSKTELEAAMKGHILGKGELIGTYQRGGS